MTGSRFSRDVTHDDDLHSPRTEVMRPQFDSRPLDSSQGRHVIAACQTNSEGSRRSRLFMVAGAEENRARARLSQPLTEHKRKGRKAVIFFGKTWWVL